MSVGALPRPDRPRGAVPSDDCARMSPSSRGTTPAPSPNGGAAVSRPAGTDPEPLRGRVRGCAALTVPVVALTWAPALQFPAWQWAALGLTVPVVTWGALPIYRSALDEVRRGRAALDVLATLTVWTALALSALSLLVGSAGASDHRQAVPLTVIGADGAGRLHLEVAAAVTTVVLGARLARGRGPTGPETWFGPAILFTAVVGAFFWFGAGAGRPAALEVTLAVLVSSLPVALALDGPAMASAAADAIRRRGITLPDRDAVRVASRVTALLIAGSDTLGPDGGPVGARTRGLGPTAVARLRGLGLDPVLLTGHTEAVARRHADPAGVEAVVACLRPGETAAAVRRVQASGGVVAVVSGDVDEAPTLAAADLGISLSSAMAADVVADSDPAAVVEFLRLARSLPATGRACRAWAAATVALAVPLAAAGLLHPALGLGVVLVGAAGVAAISHGLRGPSPEWTPPRRADLGEAP